MTKKKLETADRKHTFLFVLSQSLRVLFIFSSSLIRIIMMNHKRHRSVSMPAAGGHERQTKLSGKQGEARARSKTLQACVFHLILSKMIFNRLSDTVNRDN